MVPALAPVLVLALVRVLAPVRRNCRKSRHSPV